MLDWKLLVGVFIILLVVGSFLAGNFGFKSLDLLSGLLKDNPLGGFLSPGEIGQQTIDLAIYTGSLELDLKDKANLTSGDLNLEGFKGRIVLNFTENKIFLQQGDLKISSKLSGTSLQNLYIDNLKGDGVKFDLKGKLDVNNGTFEIKNFRGDGLLTDSLELIGNVTSLDVKIS